MTRRLPAWLGPAGVGFVLLLAAYLAVGRLAPQSLARPLLLIALSAAGLWWFLRLLRIGIRHATWRLRNRLLVTYVFIAVVPILLLAAFVLAGGYMLMNQLAVYLMIGALDRRVEALAEAGDLLFQARPERWAEEAARVARQWAYGSGMEVLIRQPGREFRYPARNSLPPSAAGRPSARGIVLLEGRPYLWSHRRSEAGTVTASFPLTRELLAGLAPQLGVIDFADPPPSITGAVRVARTGPAPSRTLPAAVHRLDREVRWFATLPAAEWTRSGESSHNAPSLFIVFRTRISAVVSAVFNRSSDLAQGGIELILAILAVVFLLVQLVSLVVGVSITRSITGAVHRLYEGTQKVTQGDFSHRIEVRGGDQLAQLGLSFNRMTENVERLLVVAKEKERMQSELEIAREVQSQLFPREQPRTRTLRITAACRPARMVSGDYYDYLAVGDSRLALAIADVAGKGISAALLMAAIQSSLRTDLHASANGALSPARVVEKLNRQIQAQTSPEKYATLCLGLYDDSSGELVYTNAGHLPPMLIRQGQTCRLEVTGTVVGAFPAVRYEECRLTLEPGDLLVLFTDGATEPENQFGEMFGEAALAELLQRNAHRGGEEILAAVEAGVREWTGSGELQDDLTLLVARRL
jgi:sigma-B regulation protein RsbU (phosphoserine phosphatase)